MKRKMKNKQKMKVTSPLGDFHQDKKIQTIKA